MKKKTRKKIGLLSLFLLMIYGAIVVYFVLFSDRLGRVDGYSTYRYNLVPFEEIRRFIQYRDYVTTGAFVLNLIGNLLVFFPVGFLVPIWKINKKGCLWIVLYSFLFSLCIESLQLVTKVGVFDVDDLLLNTLGGVFGWICYKILLAVYHRVMERRAKKANQKEG